MLTPEQIDAYAGQMADPWGELADRILRDMVRRIVKAGRITDTVEWQAYRLEALGASEQYIRRQLQTIAAEIGPQEAAIFARAMQEADAADRAQAPPEAVAQAPGLGNSPEAQQLIESGYRRTMNTLYNLTGTRAVGENQNLIETTRRQLAYYLDSAHADVASGAFSWDGATRRALRELAARGVGAITYPSGHVDSLDVVVLRATRTGISQTAGEITLHNARQMGCDLMELTAHAGARTGTGRHDYTNHAWWQGQLVSLSGRPGYLTLADIGYGDVQGFKGANCSHDWQPFWEGFSTRNYDAAALARMAQATVRYNGRDIGRYEATQMQRAMERRIRAQKRAFLAAREAGLKDDEKAAAARLSASRAKLTDFLGQTGLRKRQIQETVAGFGRSEAASAAAQARRK